MSFREKSAWVMAMVMIVTGLWYASLVQSAPDAPVIGPLLPYVLAVIAISIAVQVVLAILSPREASAPLDERERLVAARAGQVAGVVLAVSVVLAGGVYVAFPHGNMLFHHLLGGLILAQIVNYAMQIALLRRGY
ncbi:hypothetical protein [Qipengyuania sp.]|uniref:hypothetical protein n=1 Tax=Qipengyuania sp. TaxID=2004515 RepID=UPI0035C853D5